MSKLTRSAREIAPQIASNSNYYDGADLYNIGTSISQLRKPANNMALEKGMAELNRFETEEKTFQQTNMNSYFGDPEKVSAAEHERITALADEGDAAAIAQLESYAMSGSSTFFSADRSDSTYVDRHSAEVDRIVDELGLSGAQEETFRTAAYNQETASIAQNAINKNNLMVSQIFFEGVNTMDNYMDAGDYTSAQRVFDSMKSDNIITDPQMINDFQNLIYERTDTGKITSAWDAAYAGGRASVGQVMSFMEKEIGKSENWDENGLNTEEKRREVLNELYNREVGREKTRQYDASVKTADDVGNTYNTMNRFLTGEATADELLEQRGYIMDEIEKSSDGTYLSPDKKDVNQLQRLLGQIDNLLAVDPYEPTDNDKARAELAASRASVLADQKGFTNPEKLDVITGTTYTAEDGTTRSVPVEIATGYMEDTNAIYNDTRKRGLEVIEGAYQVNSSGKKLNPMDSQIRAELSTQFKSYMDEYGLEMTQHNGDEILRNLTNMVGSSITKTLDTSSEFGRAGEVYAPTFAERIGGAARKRDNRNLNKFLTSATDYGSAGLLSPTDVFDIANASQGYRDSLQINDQNQIANPDLISNALHNTPGFSEHVSANQESITMGATREGDSLVIVPTKSVSKGFDEERNLLKVTEVHIATPDLFGEEKNLELQKYGSTGDERYFISQGIDVEGNPTAPVLYEEVTLPDGRQVLSEMFGATLGMSPSSEEFLSKVYGMVSPQIVAAISAEFIQKDRASDEVIARRYGLELRDE